MPLSELYHMAKGKPQDKNNAIPADLSRPENDVFELVWENGHILLQGQSSNRTIKNSNSNTRTPRLRDRDIGGDLTNSKMGRFAGFDSVVRDVITLAPSSEVELVHDDDDDDDDMVPWLNYPNDYSSEFLPELSGVTVNDLPLHTTVASSLDQVRVRDAHLNSLPAAHLEDRSVSKVSSLNGVESGRPRSSRNQLYLSASHQCHPSFPHLRTRDENNTMSKSSHVPSIAGCSSSSTRQKLDPKPSSNSPNVINFSHFLRPAASLSKSNLQNHDGVVGAVSLSRIGSNLGSMDKDFSATSSQPHEPSLIGMRGSIRKESNSCGKNALFPAINDTNPPEAKPPDQSEAVKQPEVACLGNSSKKDDHPNQLEVGEKAIEPVTAASLCSRNSFEGASDDPIPNMKRKCHDIEDSEGHSDDVEEESVGAKRATRARGTGFKRSRAAEVHNLSERRRRDRINEKMRALQELIPNCNKVDKASMLDEAIEYLKTLQLQVQIMSMGAGLFMSPMMFAGGMQPMTAPHMAHYSPMGVGMGMGMGMGIGMPDMNGGCHGYPFVQAPHMQGTHFPGQSIPGQTAMHGMPGSTFQVLGVPGQGLHMSMPRPPIAPFSGGPFMTNSCVAVVPMENVGLAAASSSKDVCQNINTLMAPNDGIHTSITPSPRQAHEQASNVNGRAVASTSKENLIPN